MKFLKKHVNVTTKFQSLLYLCVLFSGCVNNNSKLPCGNSLSRDNTLTRYLHHNMYPWVQYEKSISAWVHCTRNKSIHPPWYPPLLTLHQLPTLEASTLPTKKYVPYKKFTQFDSLPSDFIHYIGMWHAGLVHSNKLKPVLVKLTQHHPVLFSSKFFKLKYIPFDYYIHYGNIWYVWADIYLGPHKYNCNCK